MGIEMSLPQARFWTISAYLVNNAAQQWAMFISKPNMVDIHRRRPGAFSPVAASIPAFFMLQQVIQIRWLYKLYTGKQSPGAQKAAVHYAPVFALGNFCIAAWAYWWNCDRMDLSFIPVAINSLSQLYYIAFVLPPRNKDNNLTHWNAKTFGGIGVMDFVHNASGAFFTNVPPNTLTYALTPLVAAGLVGASDWILGASISYCLGALAIGQAASSAPRSWPMLLGGLSVGGGLISYLKYKPLK